MNRSKEVNDALRAAAQSSRDVASNHLREWWRVTAQLNQESKPVPLPKTQPRPTREVEAHWWSIAMNAAAYLEEAAVGHQDPDAKRAALGAAAHVRASAQALWAARAQLGDES